VRAARRWASESWNLVRARPWVGGPGGSVRYLAVGPGAGRAAPLVGDAEVGAGVAPGVGPVGRAVVRQHPLDGDTALGEPGHGSVQDADRGRGLLVGCVRRRVFLAFVDLAGHTPSTSAKTWRGDAMPLSWWTPRSW
jgi:hypothetical protein